MKTKKHYEVGMKVSYYGHERHFGVITKLKPVVAVIEIYNINSGDTEIHEISYHRLQGGK